jgi:hypothetical protein
VSTIGKALLGGGAIVVAIVLFFLLRPDDESSSTDTATGDGGTASSGATTTTARARLKPVRLSLQVRGGTVSDVRHVTVERGRRVVVTVTADVEDEVHVHGYDLMREVAPGEPAQIAFRAAFAGRFEIELEDRGLPLAELEVEP